MGQAFDRRGDVIGEVFGATTREVFDKLTQAHKDAAEVRIGTVRDGSEGTVASPMPRYRCHKEVWALKIERVQLDRDDARVENRETDGSARLIVEGPYSTIRVDADYMRRHKPEAGGYFVVYKDGYRSFSPAAAFEEGYTRL